MKQFILFFSIIINICYAQTNPVGSNNDTNTIHSIKLDSKERCDYYVIFLGVTNYLQLPYEFLDEKDISVKISDGIIKSELDSNKVFSWQVFDTTIDSAFLLIYQKRALIKKIPAFINKDKNIIRPIFYIPKYYFHPSSHRSDIVMKLEIKDTTEYCYNISRCVWYEPENVKLKKFDIIIFNEQGNKDSLIFRNKGNIILSKFFDVYYDIKKVVKEIKFCFVISMFLMNVLTKNIIWRLIWVLIFQNKYCTLQQNK